MVAVPSRKPRRVPPHVLAITAEAHRNGVFVVRSARKPHPCVAPRERPDGSIVNRWDGSPIPADHQPMIEPGTVYVEDLAETPAYQSGPCYCRACAIAAGIARDVERRDA